VFFKASSAVVVDDVVVIVVVDDVVDVVVVGWLCADKVFASHDESELSAVEVELRKQMDLLDRTRRCWSLLCMSQLVSTKLLPNLS
jgi:hypothetical protein